LNAIDASRPDNKNGQQLPVSVFKAPVQKPTNPSTRATVGGAANCNEETLVASRDVCSFTLEGYTCDPTTCFASYWQNPLPKCYENSCNYNGIRMFNASVKTLSSEKVYMVPSFPNNATYPDEYGITVTDGDGTKRFVPGCDNKNPPGPNTGSYSSSSGGYASSYTTSGQGYSANTLSNVTNEWGPGCSRLAAQRRYGSNDGCQVGMTVPSVCSNSTPTVDTWQLDAGSETSPSGATYTIQNGDYGTCDVGGYRTGWQENGCYFYLEGHTCDTVYCFASYWQYSEGTVNTKGWDEQVPEAGGYLANNVGTKTPEPKCYPDPCPWDMLPRPAYHVPYGNSFEQVPFSFTESDAYGLNGAAGCEADNTVRSYSSCGYREPGYVCAATSCYSHYWDTNVNNSFVTYTQPLLNITAYDNAGHEIAGIALNNTLECIPDSCDFNLIQYINDGNTQGQGWTDSAIGDRWHSWGAITQTGATETEFGCVNNGGGSCTTPPIGSNQYDYRTAEGYEFLKLDGCQCGILGLRNSTKKKYPDGHLLIVEQKRVVQPVTAPVDSAGKGFCKPCINASTGLPHGNCQQHIAHSYDADTGWVPSGYNCSFGVPGWYCGYKPGVDCINTTDGSPYQDPSGECNNHCKTYRGNGMGGTDCSPGHCANSGMPGTGFQVWNCDNPLCYAEKWDQTEVTCVPNACNYDEIIPPPLSRSERKYAGCSKGGAVASGETCTWKYTGNTGPLGEDGFECGVAECYAGRWNHYQFGCYPIKCSFDEISQPSGTITFGDGCLAGEEVTDGASCSFYKPGGNKYQDIICLAGVWSTKHPAQFASASDTGDSGHQQDYTGFFAGASVGGVIAACLLGGAIAFTVIDQKFSGGAVDHSDFASDSCDDALAGVTGVEMSVNPAFEDELDLAEPGVGEEFSAEGEAYDSNDAVECKNEEELDMAEPGVAEPVEASI